MFKQFLPLSNSYFKSFFVFFDKSFKYQAIADLIQINHLALDTISN